MSDERHLDNETEPKANNEFFVVNSGHYAFLKKYAWEYMDQQDLADHEINFVRDIFFHKTETKDENGNSTITIGDLEKDEKGNFKIPLDQLKTLFSKNDPKLEDLQVKIGHILYQESTRWQSSFNNDFFFLTQSLLVPEQSSKVINILFKSLNKLEDERMIDTFSALFSLKIAFEENHFPQGITNLESPRDSIGLDSEADSSLIVEEKKESPIERVHRQLSEAILIIQDIPARYQEFLETKGIHLDQNKKPVFDQEGKPVKNELTNFELIMSYLNQENVDRLQSADEIVNLTDLADYINSRFNNFKNKLAAGGN